MVPNYPGYFPYSAGDLIDPDQYYGLIDPATNTGLGIINGNLAETSIDSGFLVDFRYTQKRSHVDMAGASGTAALDFRPKYLFPGYRGAWSNGPPGTAPAKLIPGGCEAVYMKWEGSILLTWSVFWTSYCDDNAKKSRIYLTLDGAFVEAEVRLQGQVNYLSDVRGYRKARAWNGHALLQEVAAGWHNVGLNILVDNRVGNNRVHSVNLSSITFKTGLAL